MNKYRFKTQQEFEQDGQWDKEYQTPFNWNEKKKMNQFLGLEIPHRFNDDIENEKEFKYDGWYFQPDDVVEIDRPSQTSVKTTTTTTTTSVYVLIRKK